MSPRIVRVLRRIFWMLNKFFMVPVFRLGLGSLFGSPYSGYVMVIKNRGRKSGKLRYTPVNYAIEGGKVYCTAGFGKVAHWYKNIVEDPRVELILPGGAIAAQAEVVPDQEASLDTMRQIMKNSGFAAILFGLNAFTAPDEKLEEFTKDYILLRFTPTGIGNGPGDQGGWMWIGVLAAIIAGIWWLLR